MADPARITSNANKRKNCDVEEHVLTKKVNSPNVVSILKALGFAESSLALPISTCLKTLVVKRRIDGTLLAKDEFSVNLRNRTRACVLDKDLHPTVTFDIFAYKRALRPNAYLDDVKLTDFSGINQINNINYVPARYNVCIGCGKLCTKTYNFCDYFNKSTLCYPLSLLFCDYYGGNYGTPSIPVRYVNWKRIEVICKCYVLDSDPSKNKMFSKVKAIVNFSGKSNICIDCLVPTYEMSRPGTMQYVGYGHSRYLSPEQYLESCERYFQSFKTIVNFPRTIAPIDKGAFFCLYEDEKCARFMRVLIYVVYKIVYETMDIDFFRQVNVLEALEKEMLISDGSDSSEKIYETPSFGEFGNAEGAWKLFCVAMEIITNYKSKFHTHGDQSEIQRDGIRAILQQKMPGFSYHLFTRPIVQKGSVVQMSNGQFLCLKVD